ncbi:MAG: hypothetical protein H6822_01390 [Planctomycetaceae bacterium]|nr:hypothetical protein [Planctomycetaceae bacterium]
MTHFYELNCSARTFAEGTEDNDFEGIVCPIEPRHRRAGRRVTDLHIDIVSKSIVDFSTTFIADVLITDKALNVLENAQLTGFIVKPVHIHKYRKGIDPAAVPKLWEFIVTGKGGHAHADSGIVVKSKCEACGRIRYSAYENGIIVDETTYDGSDFFTVTEYPKHILVNQRAKSVIEEHSLSNTQFIESSHLVWPEGVIKP